MAPPLDSCPIPRGFFCTASSGRSRRWESTSRLHATALMGIDMERNCHSLTAHRVAMRRAAHQLLDDPKVLDDPIALEIISAQDRSDLRAATGESQTILSRYLRAFVIARSRYAEDGLSEAVKHGIRQYVILGAGLDTFGYRNPFSPSLLRVFEVDHPATQEWKRKQLAAAGIPIPPSLTFAPIDFEQQTLAAQLREVGFRTEEPAFFSWLGVTMYLTRECGDDDIEIYLVVHAHSQRNRIRLRSPAVMAEPDPALRFSRYGSTGCCPRRAWQTFFDPQSLAAELRSIIDVDQLFRPIKSFEAPLGHSEALRVAPGDISCSPVRRD